MTNVINYPKHCVYICVSSSKDYHYICNSNILDMEIRDRLVKIISSEGLTSAAFADSIGVQRSSISHIISGRNKPSLDFLQKILTSYPKYNAEWLIIGLGDIYKQPKQSNLFKKPEAPRSFSHIKNEIPSVAEEMKNDQLSTPLEALNEGKKDVEEENSPIYETVDPFKLPNKPEKSRKIHKIVVFYEDRTFTEYNPSID